MPIKRNALAIAETGNSLSVSPQINDGQSQAMNKDLEKGQGLTGETAHYPTHAPAKNAQSTINDRSANRKQRGFVSRLAVSCLATLCIASSTDALADEPPEREQETQQHLTSDAAATAEGHDFEELGSAKATADFLQVIDLDFSQSSDPNIRAV